MLGRVATLVYGVIAYLVFFFAFLYAIGFVGDMVVPKSIDSGEPTSTMMAILINALLLGLFAVQHSIMARPWFKTIWTKIVPAAAERSTYVLLASLILLLIYWQWRPLPQTVWQIQNEVVTMILHALFWLGWGIVLISTFIINHFDLFGLRHIWLNWRGEPYTYLPFKVTAFYRVVRHPIMLGFIVAFWAAPTMSQGRLLFAIATSAYILVALQFEERDLVHYHGERYAAYKSKVPMIVPLPKLAEKQLPDVATERE